MTYAARTEVPFERSIGEIVAALRKAGADRIGQMDGNTEFALQFELADRSIRFRLPFMTGDEAAAAAGPRQTVIAVAEQWRRQRGRALLLVVKAKLESIASGIETVEQAFLANVVMPGDMLTVHERISGNIAFEYRQRSPHPLLEGPSA